jgi:exo-1,4-beta-D-glucosaminidase
MLIARIVGLDGTVLFRKDTLLRLPTDTVLRPVVLPAPPPGTTAYFADLRIISSDGRALSRNFYWLSSSPDDLDFAKSTWYITPVKQYADFTALQTMTPTRVTRSLATVRNGQSEVASVTLTNLGKVPAFFVRLQLIKGPGGGEVLPIIWSDNYVSLLPGESRVITAAYAVSALLGERARLVITGTNVK